MYEFLVENGTFFTAFLLASFFAAVIFHVISRNKYFSSLPPGPRLFSIIVNVLEVKNKGILNYFENCREKYGDIFCVRFFGIKLIVFNGFDVLKDAFGNNSRLFSGRPLSSYHEAGGIAFENGEQWKANRRFALQTLRDFGMGRDLLTSIIQEEIEAALHDIEKHEGNPFDIGPLLDCAVANIISSILFGKRFSYSDDSFLRFIKRLHEITSDPMLLIGLKGLRYIPGDPFGRNAAEIRLQETQAFYFEIIDRHYIEYSESNIKDFIDAYIKQTKTVGSVKAGADFNKRQLQIIIGDLLSAGSETTTTVLKWGLIYLLRDQKTQQQIYDEVRENVPQDRRPIIEDKKALPFVEATVLEILRLGNVGPLGIPHAAITECTFRGFHIPKDAYIIPNLQSVLYDKATCGDPMTFRPSRFLSGDGTVIQKERWVPFSIGRRSCMGESLARLELFLFFSALVQRFKFIPPEGEDPPTLDATLGVTRAPRPFMMRAVKRLE